MPIYEYRCQDCRDEIEVQQSFSDDALTACPSCSGTLKKKFSSPGISFKGSGFYKTDSRSGSSSSPAKTDAGDKSDKGDKGDKGESSTSTSTTSSSDSSSKSDSSTKKSDSSSSSSTPAAASA